MKIVPPYQISAEILTIINQAEKYIVLVSPFVEFKNWGALKQELEKAIKRGVVIEFFTRYDADNNKSWEQIQALGIQPKLVKHLHAKLYYNEKQGIVTSMNLLTSSNLSAIEFGSRFDSKEEIQELKYFVKQFLMPHLEQELPSDDELYIAKEKFIIVLERIISNVIKGYVRCKFENENIIINAGNKFTLSLDKVKKHLNLWGIISSDESMESDLFIQKINKEFKGYNAYLDGEKGSMCALYISSSSTFTSDIFNFLKVPEKKEIIFITCNFIGQLLDFKQECYEKRKNANV